MARTIDLAILTDTRDTVATWFFDDYLPRWVAAGSEGHAPTFITEYWGAPLWVSIDDNVALLSSIDQVVSFLREMHERLRASGYTHTVVPDRRIVAFTPNSADVSVIWSRRRADSSEIERLAVVFAVMNTADGWRVVAIRAVNTTGDQLDDLWPVHDIGALR